MSILSWIISGLIAGWLADVTMKGSGYGVFADIGLGIIGALAGGFLAGYLFGIPYSDVNLVTLVLAWLGAVTVVAIIRAFPKRTRV